MCADQKKLLYSITVSPRYVSQCLFYMLIFILAFIKEAMCYVAKFYPNTVVLTRYF